VQLLKLEWLRANRELREAMNADVGRFIRENDLIEEAEMVSEPRRSEWMEQPTNDMDNMMVDIFEQEEQAEIDSLVSSLPLQTAPSSAALIQPGPLDFSDDEEYELLLHDILLADGRQDMPVSQDVEML
jgi:hypothetical protein